MLFQAFPVMLGDIDLKGNLNAQIIHQFTDAIRGKFIVQVCSNIISNFKRDFKYIKCQVIDRDAPELGSGRNSDFLKFRFRPELMKMFGRNRNFLLVMSKICGYLSYQFGLYNIY